MKKLTSIQVKALFLLTVFAINTVVGFACAVGVDMGFNTKHHEKETSNKVHIHKDGTRHVHAGKPDAASPAENKGQTAKVHIHKDGSRHIHAVQEAQNAQPEQKEVEGEIHIHKDGKKHLHPGKKGSNTIAKDAKGNCCTDDVVKLSQDDKIVASLLKLTDPVFVKLISIFYNELVIDFLPQRTVSNKYFVRGHHPPISDIRIVIQSFQI